MREASSSVTRRSALALPLAAGAMLIGCAADPAGVAATGGPADPEPRAPAEPETRPEPQPDDAGRDHGRALLLASLAKASHVAVIDPSLPEQGAVRRIRVGAAPWGVGVDAAHGVGYAATAEGLAVIDLDRFTRRRLVRYRHRTNRVGQGEYRPGGLGLAVSPSGDRVYVAVTDGGGDYHLEVFDTKKGRFVADVPVGLRPFDVLVAPDGAWAATVDHDSFTLTVVDARTLKPRTHRIAPFGSEGGLASWEKAHYGAVDAAGRILLPYQGLLVADVDPRSGRFRTVESRADSHAHGTALAGRRLLTVGTGAFGNANGEPNLSILNLDTGRERIVPLAKPHETVAVWRDSDGSDFAAVAGGNTRDQGWDGVTLVKLKGRDTRRIAVPGYPQAIVSYTGRGFAGA